MTPLQTKTIHWLAHGDTGMSSETMAFWIAFGELVEDGRNYPHDPADFDRCLRLLAAVPEMRLSLCEMEKVSLVWAALVAKWDEIEKCHLDEVGLHWTKSGSARLTYTLMRKIIEAAKQKGETQ